MTYPALTALHAIYRPDRPAFMEKLTAAQRAVLAVLVMYADDNATCFPKIPTLCRASGYSRSMVIRTLAELEALEVLSRHPRPPRVTVYTLQVLDRPRSGPSTVERVTVHSMDGDSPHSGPERLSERHTERPKADAPGGAPVASDDEFMSRLMRLWSYAREDGEVHPDNWLPGETLWRALELLERKDPELARVVAEWYEESGLEISLSLHGPNRNVIA